MGKNREKKKKMVKANRKMRNYINCIGMNKRLFNERV